MTVHLIHVGFPRTGTTTLQHWFATHPEIAFAYDRLGGYEGALAFARQTAELAPTPAIVTSWEGLVIPLASFHPPVDIVTQRERVCHRLHALFPNATALIVTRAHHSAFASTYSLYVTEGGTQGRTDLYRTGKASEHDRGVEDYYDYDAVVSLYERTFGADQVMVTPYELLRDDPIAFIGRLEGRLGLRRSGLSPERLNVSLSPNELTWYPRISRVIHRAARASGRNRSRIVTTYVGALQSGRLRRHVDRLARVTPETWNRPQPDIPADILDRCRERVAQLVTRPEYAPYRGEYLRGAAST